MQMQMVFVYPQHCPTLNMKNNNYEQNKKHEQDLHDYSKTKTKRPHFNSKV